jgi:hypothetical protein
MELEYRLGMSHQDLRRRRMTVTNTSLENEAKLKCVATKERNGNLTQ